MKTVMIQQPIRVQVAEIIREAGRRMRNNGVSAVPVMQSSVLVGIIIGRDLVDALVDG